MPGEMRKPELIYVGRLVGEKGVDILLNALSLLKIEGVNPKLTIVGGGPEEAQLRVLASSLGLDSTVRFAGVKRGEDLAQELNRHQILVVPSRYDEPFGIVALEGMACGCVVVGSRGGGLREAIGPGGVTFPNGDIKELANCLRVLLADEDRIRALRDHVAEHLARFTKANVANTYLETFRCLLNPSQG